MAQQQDMQHCIQECTDCHQVCLRTIQHCLGMGGKHAEQQHIRLMADCAQICAVSADFMLRGSPLHEAQNLFLTPRLGSLTRESRQRASWYVAQRLHETLSRPRTGNTVFDALPSGPMGLEPDADFVAR